MKTTRPSILLNAAFATVFITATTGIVLWIVTFLAVSEAERVFEFMGLLARTWERGHQTQVNMITGALWTPIIAVLAVCVFRRVMATEKAVRNGRDG